MAVTAGSDGYGSGQRVQTPSGTSSIAAQAMAAYYAGQATSQGVGGLAQQYKPLTIKLGNSDLSVTVAPGVAGWETGQNRSTTFSHPGVREFTTPEEAVQSWYLMDEDYRAQVMDDMFSFGLIDGPNREDQAEGVWNKAVEFAWNYAQNGKDVAPTDMFARMTTLKAGEQGPDGVRTSVSKSFRYLDASGAEALVRGAFRQAVGRDATDAELRTMAGSIVDASKQNPTVTTQTVDREGNSTSTTEGGFDPNAYLANRLDSDPEARAHQAAADLYPALMSLFQPGG